MNLQTLKSTLVKGQSDFTKEVIVVIDGKEYAITSVIQLLDKTLLAVKAKIPVKIEEDEPVKEVIKEETKEETKKK